jgi:hypothetical protein
VSYAIPAVAALPLGSLDFGNARLGISSDIYELRTAGAFGWTILSIAAALPVTALFLIVFARSVVAVIPLAIAAGLFGLWFLYYATDWFSNPGQGAWMPAFMLVLFGWGVLLYAIGRTLRRRAFRLPFRSAIARR